MQPTIVSKPGARAVPSPLHEGLVFEDVGFRYPGSETWALRHVNLHVGAKERITLVGENGAGKTTLTKLLARLYDPTQGRIHLLGLHFPHYNLSSLLPTTSVHFHP